MTELRLEADDPRVIELTLRALAAARQKPTPALTFKCKRCGKKLAFAGQTEHGPLFVSTWMVPIMSGVVLNGKHLTAREVRKESADNIVFERGRQDFEEPHGTLALFELPGGMAQDYPDLLVRCSKHGDAVLERETVLAFLCEAPNRAPTRQVEVTLPKLEYRRPRQDDVETQVATDLGVKSRSRRSIVVTQCKGRPSRDIG
jgi:hypothetical protein